MFFPTQALDSHAADAAFGGRPLAQVAARWLELAQPEAEGRAKAGGGAPPPSAAALPFDLEAHPTAQSFAAREMLGRLRTCCAALARTGNCSLLT